MRRFRCPLSGMTFKHPTKRGAHWVELETDMTDDRITPDTVDSNGNVDRCVFPLGECALAARLAEVIAALQSIVKFVEIADDPTHHTLGLVGNIARMALGEEPRAQKQADEHRARGGYVGGV